MINLKLIYIVIDGMGDLPIEELGNKTPLEAAETPHMDYLAKKGVTGLMYTVGEGIAPESDAAVFSILGYDPFKYHLSRGVVEAIGGGLSVKNGDLALRCNFATLGPGNVIIDRRVGRNLTTEEAVELSKAINEEVKLESYPAEFEFKSTIGHRCVLVIRSKEKPLSSNITNTDPAYYRVKEISVAKPSVEMALKKCEPMDETEEARIAANLVNEFTEKSHLVLEEHEVNKRRAREGKLKANVVLMRDAGHIVPKLPKVNEMYNVRFAALVDMPIEKGISKLIGMDVVALPPPSKKIEEDCTVRVKALLSLLPLYDCFYIHIKGPDEPGHDGDFKLKTQLIAKIDKYFVGKLLEEIRLEDYIICITADHSTPCKMKVHTDNPVPLLISGDRIQGDEVSSFSEKECRKGSLGILRHGTGLMPKLINLMKSNG